MQRALAAGDPFFSAPQIPTSTSAGEISLPIFYTDATLLTLIWRVDPAVARACIPHAALEPWTLLGKAFAMLCVFDYRATSIGPYREIGLGILAKRTGTSPSLLSTLIDMRAVPDTALYVTNLPVTTEAARAAGVELWGYPKYVAPILTEFRDDGSRATLAGEFDLRIGAQTNVPMPGMPLVTYSVKDAELLRTIVDVDHTQRWGGADTAVLRVTGDGPTARTMRTLGIDRPGVTPFLAFRADRMRSVLPRGTVMGSAG